LELIGVTAGLRERRLDGSRHELAVTSSGQGSGTIRAPEPPAEERFEMHSSRIAKVGLIAAAATLLLVVPAFGTPKASIMEKVTPASIKAGHKVTLKLSGFAPSPTNYVYVGYAPSATCPTAFSSVAKTAPAASATVKPGKSFSAQFKLAALAKGKHVLCAYLLHRTHTKIYAKSKAASYKST
jgi:hypothetical protein